MLQLITPETYRACADAIRQMHELRFRVFKERLGWDVATVGELEIDSFDELDPHYLLLRGSNGSVVGCVRLLPSTGPTMLRDVFPELLDENNFESDADVWESSRFALDPPPDAATAAGGIAVGTYQLFAGMIAFGLSQKLSRIVTVTDLRMERILKRAGWPLDRIGEPRTIGKTRAVAGYLPVSQAYLDAVCSNGGLDGPMLWAPVDLGAM